MSRVEELSVDEIRKRYVQNQEPTSRRCCVAVLAVVAACGVVPPPPPTPAATASPPPKTAPDAKPATAPAPKAPAVAAAKPAAPPKAAAPVQPKPAPAVQGLDLKSLEQKLKDTQAIGLMTKLTIKNQVDDLVSQFRAYHEGRRPPTLTELRRPYELLLMKLLSLLQDKDPGLARTLNESRESIWGVLSDRSKFAEHA